VAQFTGDDERFVEQRREAHFSELDVRRRGFR
jgi:hypothetical protein